MRLIVCGGRNWNDRSATFHILDRIHAKRPITLIIHGDCRGADRLADEWARSRGIAVEPHPANWDLYGPGAGPIRNQEMLDAAPDGVVAFPGGNGTADMISRATIGTCPFPVARNRSTRWASPSAIRAPLASLSQTRCGMPARRATSALMPRNSWLLSSAYARSQLLGRRWSPPMSDAPRVIALVS